MPFHLRFSVFDLRLTDLSGTSFVGKSGFRRNGLPIFDSSWRFVLFRGKESSLVPRPSCIVCRSLSDFLRAPFDAAQGFGSFWTSFCLLCPVFRVLPFD